MMKISLVALVMGVVLAQQPPGPPVVRVGTAKGNDYFTQLVKLPQHYRSWTLRDQAQIDSLQKNRSTPSEFFFYDPTWDAARYERPIPTGGSSSIPLAEQLRMPIGIGGTASVLIIHDFYYTDTWVTNRGTLRAQKTFQVRLNGDKRFWTFTNSSILSNALPYLSRAHNSASLSSVPDPEGRTKSDPLRPEGVGAIGENYRLRVNTWYRYVHLLELGRPATDPVWDAWKSLNSIDAAGRSSANLTRTWTALSLWLMNETEGPVRIHYRVPVDYIDLNGLPSSVGAFEYEFNTSTSEPALTGPLIGYGRNVVVLKDYPLPPRPEDDPVIFRRPVK